MKRGSLLRLTALSAVFYNAMGIASGQSSNVNSTNDVDSKNTIAADLILAGGQVLTPKGWSESLAVKDGIIVAVGKVSEVDTYRGKATEYVSLNQRTVLPGIHDMHVHPLFAGLEQAACGFPPAASARTIIDAVASCVANAQPGDWIVGGNWVAAVFKEGEQTRQLLDQVSPNNPVALNDEAHHSVWVNTAALEKVGITKETPNPPGGIIEKGADGIPNGLLRETAADLLMAQLPLPTKQEKQDALILASDTMLSFGITSYTIASVRTDEIADIAELSGSGQIKQRVRGCLVWNPEPQGLRKTSERLIENRLVYQRPRFNTNCVKMFLDGVPTESQTAAMLDPYVKHTHHRGLQRPERGILMIPQNDLHQIVAQFDRQGLQIKFHVVGDRAVRNALDAVALAREANGWGGPIHELGHNTFVHPTDIPRVKALNMAWEFSPYIWYPTPIAEQDVANAVGQERMKRFIPIRDAIETGALVVAGSDWSVVPSVNPWLAMETMVTREKPGGSDNRLGEGQAVSFGQAFQILTTNGAKLMGHRSNVGSLEVGMMADMIVTRSNPFQEPIRDIHTTEVLMTFVDGDLVYEKDAL